MYICLNIFFLFVSELFSGGVVKTFVILSEILFTIKSPVASAVSRIAIFEAALGASEIFDYIYYLNFCLYFYQCFLPIFLAQDKNP